MNGINEIYHEPPINSIVGISSTFNLTGEDLQKRSGSFLDANTLRLTGVRGVNDDVAHQILGKESRIKDVEYAGLAIPYFQFSNDGTRYVAGWAVRRDVPDFEKNGRGELKEKRKYIKHAGVKNQLYIPPMLPPELLTDNSLPIVFVEGEFKAAALARIATRDFSQKEWLFVPLGLSGVDNFRKKGKAETPHGVRSVSEELTEFQRIAFENRSVGICFDSDLSDKPAVKAARTRLSSFLKEKKAKVFHINFPRVYQGIQTKGVDDFLGAVEKSLGKDRAIGEFLDLLDKAQKPKKSVSPVADKRLCETQITDANQLPGNLKTHH